MDDDGWHKVWTTQSYLIQKMNFQDSKILKKLTKIVFMGLWLPRRHCFKKGYRDEAKSWLEKLRPTTLQ